MKYFLLTGLFACLALALQAQEFTLPDLKGTAWYVSEVIELHNGNTVKRTIKRYTHKDNALQFHDDGRYTLRNFFGLDSLEGFLVENGNVMVWTNPSGTGYYWVFEVLSRTNKACVLRYVPHHPAKRPRQIVLRRNLSLERPDLYPPETQESEALSLNLFSGEWMWTASGKTVRLTIKQVGNILTGTHCYGPACATRHSFSGSVRGQEARVKLYDEKTGQVLGTASLKLVLEDKLSWQVLDNPRQALKTISNINLVRIPDVSQF